jgi:hypothetical protein
MGETHAPRLRAVRRLRGAECSRVVSDDENREFPWIIGR